MFLQDKEQQERIQLEILNTAEFANLATINSNNTPYCVPVSFVFSDGAIYFHGALKGKKVENIANNNNVCITLIGKTQVVQKDFTTLYESVIVSGKAVVLDAQEKISAMKLICRKYTPDMMDKFGAALAPMLDKMLVYKVTADKISSKIKVS